MRHEANDLIDDKVRAHTVERHAWQFLKDTLKALPVRRRLDLAFHAAPAIRSQLDRYYELQVLRATGTTSYAAQHYKSIPQEARKNLAAWQRGRKVRSISSDTWFRWPAVSADVLLQGVVL